MKVFRRKFKSGTLSDSWYVRYKDLNGKEVWKSFENKIDAENYLGEIRLLKAGIHEEKVLYDILAVVLRSGEIYFFDAENNAVELGVIFDGELKAKYSQNGLPQPIF